MAASKKSKHGGNRGSKSVKRQASLHTHKEITRPGLGGMDLLGKMAVHGHGGKFNLKPGAHKAGDPKDAKVHKGIAGSAHVPKANNKDPLPMNRHIKHNRAAHAPHPTPKDAPIHKGAKKSKKK